MMLTERKYKLYDTNNILKFPTTPEQDDPDNWQSTEMECLYTVDEIIKVNDVFVKAVNDATSFSKKRNAMRNLTMYKCAINIGLRGGDFVKLRWRDIYDDKWKIKDVQEFVPEKTVRRSRTGKILKRKYVKLRYDSDFRDAIETWRLWLKENGVAVAKDDYCFISSKSGHISEKTWYKTIEKYRIAAGIKQKIGTHGLRKTYGHRYYICSDNKSEAVVQLCDIFAHSSLNITLRYICVTNEDITKNQEKMCVFTHPENQYDFLCPQDLENNEEDLV